MASQVCTPHKLAGRGAAQSPVGSGTELKLLYPVKVSRAAPAYVLQKAPLLVATNGVRRDGVAHNVISAWTTAAPRV